MRRETPFVAAGLVAVLSPSATTAQFSVTTTLDTPDANPDDGVCSDLLGHCSLRAAIQEANARGGAHVVQLQSGATHTLTMAGPDEDSAATGDLDAAANIDVIGNGATIDAPGVR